MARFSVKPITREPFNRTFNQDYMHKIDKKVEQKKITKHNLTQLAATGGDDAPNCDIMSERDQTLSPVRGRKMNQRMYQTTFGKGINDPEPLKRSASAGMRAPSANSEKSANKFWTVQKQQSNFAPPKQTEVSQIFSEGMGSDAPKYKTTVGKSVPKHLLYAQKQLNVDRFKQTTSKQYDQ